ncbi:MAG: 30S ribosomal protein S8 [Candidatus Nomurabacteria bacterium]|jgi:small subunit ribosomal protein S8|nr:30S ribosomal protein S8 [Candidatus Nomurabacteria bacterium]
MSLQTTDGIADMITRIRNAIAVNKNEVLLPASKLKLAVAQELKKIGYLTDVKVESNKPQDLLRIVINEAEKNANITEIVRVSKPGRRVYVGATEIPRVKSGRGTVILSTSKGILSGYEAHKAKIGGEVLVKVY